MLNLDWAERNGFTFVHSGRLRRCSTRMLFQDYPVLWRIKPILSGFRKLDRIAFAAELLELGYSIGQVRGAAGCTINTTVKLRDRMKLLGLIPEYCGCGAALGHGGWCKFRLAQRGMVRRHHWATYTADNQPRAASSGFKGVYWDKEKQQWTVQRRIQGKTYRHGRFDRKEDAIAKSLEVWSPQ